MKYTFKIELDIDKTPKEISSFIFNRATSLDESISLDTSFISDVVNVISKYIGVNTSTETIGASNMLLIPTDILNQVQTPYYNYRGKDEDFIV